MLLLGGRLLEKADLGYDGSRGWMGDIRIAGESAGVDVLVNTLLVSRFQHHYPLVAGSYEDEVLECMAWLGIEPLKPVPYKDYMQNFN
jgi:hypothetical protein